MIVRLLCASFLWLIALPAMSAAPDWVEPRFDYDALLDSQRPATSPTDYLIYSDMQLYLKDGYLWSYSDQAYRINNQQMLEASGQINLPYFEGLQDATLLTVERIRGGVRTDVTSRLSAKKIAEGSIFEGEQARTLITESFFVPDLKIGDALRVKMMYQNFDADFKDIVNRRFQMINGTYVEKASLSLRLPRSMNINVQHQVWDPKSETRSIGSDTLYIWSADGVNVTLPKRNVPADYAVFPYTEISTLKDWSAVSQWAQARFNVSDEAASAVAKEAKRITQGLQTRAEKIHAIALFMQSNIRYEGGELGRHGYQPRTPLEVLQTGYGDCKDQTTLAVALLNSADVEAYPALVQATSPGWIETALPGIAAFDHVIVHVPSAHDVQWFDPAYPPLSDEVPYLSTLTYRKGLILDGKASALTPISVPRHPNYDYTDWERTFINVVEGGNEENLLAFRIQQFFGALASQVMSVHAASQAEQFSEIFKNIADSALPGKVMPIKYTVMSAQGSVARVDTAVPLVGAWERNEKKSGYDLVMRYGGLEAIPDIMEDPVVDHDVALTYPNYTCQDFLLYIPQSWSAKLKNLKIESSVHRFEISSLRKDDHLDIRMEYEVKKERLLPAEFKRYAKDIEKIEEHLELVLSISNKEFSALKKAQKAHRKARAGDNPEKGREAASLDVPEFTPEFLAPIMGD